jgi:hypothetical protein
VLIRPQIRFIESFITAARKKLITRDDVMVVWIAWNTARVAFAEAYYH